MSANVDSMFSVRQTPWHGLGEIIQEAPTSDEAIRQANLGWRVIQEPLMTTSGLPTNLIGNVREDTRAFLGAVTGRYQIVQNEEAFSFMDALSSKEVVYETAGVLGVGEQVWLLAKLDNFKILDDDVEGYICLTNSHDGKGSVKISVTPVRVVCQNTLNLALAQAHRTWTTRHMGDFSAKKIQASQTLGLYENYMGILSTKAEELVSKPLSKGEVDRTIKTLFPSSEDDSERKIRNIESMRNEVAYIYNEAPDLQNYRGTAWGFVNAVADFVDHTEPQRKTDTFAEKRFKKVVNGHDTLDKALALVS